MSLLLANHLPDLVCVLLQQMRHIHLLVLVPREGHTQVQCSILRVLCQFLEINQIISIFPLSLALPLIALTSS